MARSRPRLQKQTANGTRHDRQRRGAKHPVQHRAHGLMGLQQRKHRLHRNPSQKLDHGLQIKPHHPPPPPCIKITLRDFAATLTTAYFTAVQPVTGEASPTYPHPHRQHAKSGPHKNPHHLRQPTATGRAQLLRHQPQRMGHNKNIRHIPPALANRMILSRQQTKPRIRRLLHATAKRYHQALLPRPDRKQPPATRGHGRSPQTMAKRQRKPPLANAANPHAPTPPIIRQMAPRSKTLPLHPKQPSQTCHVFPPALNSLP